MEFYQFLAYFCIDPYIKGKMDNQIIYTPYEDEYLMESGYSIEKEYLPRYLYIRDCKTNCSDTNRVKKEILDIIKHNTKQNLNELKKSIVDLFKMDEQSKNSITRLSLP